MTTVQDNPAEHRYEIHDGDQLAGFVEYERTDDTIAFTHTEVDPAFQGRGIARELVVGCLEDVRPRDLAVLPLCPYVAKVIGSDVERFLDLVPVGERERFGLAGDG